MEGTWTGPPGRPRPGLVGGPVAPWFRRAPGTFQHQVGRTEEDGIFWGRGSQPLSDSVAGQLQGSSGQLGFAQMPSRHPQGQGLYLLSR